MSKIFQALHGAQNEISELLPALIGDEAPAAEAEAEAEYAAGEPAPESPQTSHSDVAAVPISSAAAPSVAPPDSPPLWASLPFSTGDPATAVPPEPASPPLSSSLPFS